MKHFTKVSSLPLLGLEYFYEYFQQVIRVFFGTNMEPISRTAHVWRVEDGYNLLTELVELRGLEPLTP